MFPPAHVDASIEERHQEGEQEHRCVHEQSVGTPERPTELWFNRGMGSKLKSFILAIVSPVCNGGLGHRIM